MTREGRAITLAGLTFFMFALSILLTNGGFVFPYPLNEFVLLIVSSLFLLWHPRKGALPYLFFFSALAGVMASKFLWEIVFSLEQLEEFYSYTVVDWALLTSGVFLLAAMLVFLTSYREWYLKALVALCTGVYVWAFITNELKLYCLAFLGFVIVGTLKPVRKPFHLIWILYFVLYAMKWITPFLA